MKEFLSRPENQAVVERQQRKEVKQAMQLQQKMQALQFRDKVSSSFRGRNLIWLSTTGCGHPPSGCY